MDKEKLYRKIDEDEELSDKEKREIYRSELKNNKDYENN